MHEKYEGLDPSTKRKKIKYYATETVVWIVTLGIVAGIITGGIASRDLISVIYRELVK